MPCGIRRRFQSWPRRRARTPRVHSPRPRGRPAGSRGRSLCGVRRHGGGAPNRLYSPASFECLSRREPSACASGRTACSRERLLAVLADRHRQGLLVSVVSLERVDLLLRVVVVEAVFARSRLEKRRAQSLVAELVVLRDLVGVEKVALGRVEPYLEVALSCLLKPLERLDRAVEVGPSLGAGHPILARITPA